MTEYDTFIQTKRIADEPSGMEKVPRLSRKLYPFQKDIVRWALRRGRAAIFADCGLGKTPMQLEWARHIAGRVMIVAPLAVGAQTVREADKFGVIGVKYLRKDDPGVRIVVTNYEMLEYFDPARFDGVVLDESSILKSYTGKFRNHLIDHWGKVPFRLAATATPAPNDFMELGNHSEFLGAMTRAEMLAHFFVHDAGETQKWRIKGHAEDAFWEWLASWAVMMRNPSDMGYDDGGFDLPPVKVDQLTVAAPTDNLATLFPMAAHTLTERRQARRDTIAERVRIAAAMANESDEPWLVWCDLNAESGALAAAIPDAIEVRGSDDAETKENRLNAFSEGRARVLVTKPSIAGFGMNWQHCARMVFTGLSDSYEKFYQALRRCWRFGQTKPVHAWVITSETEGAVVSNILRKGKDADRMAMMMVRHMTDLNRSNLKSTTRMNRDYIATEPIDTPSFI